MAQGREHPGPLGCAGRASPSSNLLPGRSARRTLQTPVFGQKRISVADAWLSCLAPGERRVLGLAVAAALPQPLAGSPRAPDTSAGLGAVFFPCFPASTGQPSTARPALGKLPDSAGTRGPRYPQARSGQSVAPRGVRGEQIPRWSWIARVRSLELGQALALWERDWERGAPGVQRARKEGV